MVSPEHRTFRSDQSVDKSARRSAAAAVRNPRERWGEGSPLLRTSREDTGAAGLQPEAKISGLNLYEAMSRRYGNQTCLTSPDPAALYENCLKCLAERCHPPTRMSGNIYARVCLAKTGQHEAAAKQEGSQSKDGPRGEEGKGPLQSCCASFCVVFPFLGFESSLLCSSLCFHQ